MAEQHKHRWITLYIRRSNPQRWVRVGLYCDGCKTHMPD